MIFGSSNSSLCYTNLFLKNYNHSHDLFIRIVSSKSNMAAISLPSSPPPIFLVFIITKEIWSNDFVFLHLYLYRLFHAFILILLTSL